jgi:hypothetical protein
LLELSGFVLVIITTVCMLALAVYAKGNDRRLLLRPIQALQRLQKAIARVVESGNRIHISLGNANITDPNNASTFVGLSTLERIAQLSVASDNSPYATSGESAIALLSKNMLHAGFHQGGSLELFDPDNARLSGITSFSYIGGLMPLVHDKEISTHLLIGHFGSEIALIVEAANREKAFILGASDSLPAQSVMFATTPDALIGEELFAPPAYIQAGNMHRASLHTQDILRWILILVMIGGAALKILGII